MLRRALRLVSAAVVGLAIAACTGTAASPTPSQPAATPSASPAGTGAASPAGSGAAISVTAIDYAFQGVPDTLAPGTSLSLVNAGKELHELVLVRRNADVTQSFEELLKLPEADASKFITFLGGLMAPPGATAEGTVTADLPGDYALICFIPQGTTALPTGSASLSPGPPHFVLGMLKLVTVR